MAKLIPWTEVEEEYAKKFTIEIGAPAKPSRMALGALIIKEKLGISDRETVEQIRENPYLQLSWDNFNESGDFKSQAEDFKLATGNYPESIHVDQIYRTKENRGWCKARGVRITGIPLGRKPKVIDKEKKKQAQLDERFRSRIEGKLRMKSRRGNLGVRFTKHGEAKRRYSLGRVMTKLFETSKTAIAITFLVMNLSALLRQFFAFFWISLDI
jgi:Transposase DDE domain/Transposase domain (DUF772)